MTDRNRDEKRNPREKNNPGQKSGQTGAQNRDDRREQGGSQANRKSADAPSQNPRSEVERNQGGQASRGEPQRDEQGQFLPEGRDERAEASDASDRSGRSGGSQGDDRAGRAQQGTDREGDRIPADGDVDSPQRHGDRPAKAHEERNRKSGS